MRNLSLESSLPILQSKKKTIVLLSSQLSLMVVIQNPTPAKIVSGARTLFGKCESQNYFSTDFWGESVTKRTKAEVKRMLEKNMRNSRYDDIIRAGMTSVDRKIQSITHADFFTIT